MLEPGIVSLMKSKGSEFFMVVQPMLALGPGGAAAVCQSGKCAMLKRIRRQIGNHP
jgi:hypothetical protein